MTKAKAIQHIERHGMLLTYPLHNAKEPASLWSSFFPKSKMVWEWDNGADNRVAELWLLREELSRSGKVVYAKWFQGRATFFSRPVFAAALARLWFVREGQLGELSRPSQDLLSALELSSPLSTKELKAETDLKGRDNERDYEKGLKALWQRLLVVGFGEKDDGAFPSLLVGSTQLLFEDLWNEAQSMTADTATGRLEEKLGATNPFFRHFAKTLKRIEGA